MHFGFPAEALDLQAGVRDVLTGACTPAVVRAAWPGGDAAQVASLWRSLGELGLTGLLVPERDGGLGLDDLVAVAALTEVGRAAVPGPVVETVAVAAPLLAAAGALPEGVLDGTVQVAVQRDGAALVPYAQTADLVLQLRGDEAHLLESPQVEPVDTVDGSRAAGRVTGTGSRLDVPADAVRLASLRGSLGTAAVLLGLSARMLALTVEYVQGRQQFGVPIGSFQAVKHPLANATVDLEFAEPAVARAGLSLVDDEPDAALHVAAAKAAASDAAWAVSRATLQAHGAMAYTVEYDLHLLAKRAWALAQDWGTAAEHRETVASALLGPR